MKVDLNIVLVDLDGKEIDKSNAGKLVANLLSLDRKGDSLKYWDWALKLNKGEVLDLDPSDFDTLRRFIKGNDNLTNLVEAQVLTQLDKTKK